MGEVEFTANPIHGEIAGRVARPTRPAVDVTRVKDALRRSAAPSAMGVVENVALPPPGLLPPPNAVKAFWGESQGEDGASGAM